MFNEQKAKRRISSGMIISMGLILVLTVIAGCSSSNRSDADSSAGSAPTEMLQASMQEAGNYNQTVLTNAKADAGGGGLPDISIGGTAFNEKIIYTATMTMKVDKLAEAVTELRKAIEKSGGYILEFNDTKHNGEIGAIYKIKVPSPSFMPFLDRVEQMENRHFERSYSGQDVSREYVDLESRLKARQLVEERLLSMMDKATKADDLLQYSNQLGAVEEDIERIKGELRYLDNNIAFSTVELRLYQTDQTIVSVNADKQSLGGKLSDTIQSSTKVVLEGLQLLLIFIVGALPVLAVLALIGIPTLAIIRYRRRRLQLRMNKSDNDQV